MPPPDDRQFWPEKTGAAQPEYAPAGQGVPPELLALNTYDDVQFLDKGGMGAVYLARNRLMDRLEVLKVVGREFLGRPDLVERFLREIRAAARLGHPNVVTAYSAYEVNGNLIFAMEYVPGETLTQAVKARGPMPPPAACFYAYQVAVGLQHAHERGMVHRDIKPGNLRLLKEGRKRTVKILDFGLAKATSERGAEVGMTAAGTALGTPEYMPPEQADDAATADIRADIYALGGTLFYLLTGRPPFSAGSVYALLLAHREDAPPRLDGLVPNLPAGLAEVVDRMLAKAPADRFQTPAEAARALARFLPGPASRQIEAAVSAPDEAQPQPLPLPSTAAGPSWSDDGEEDWLRGLPEAEGDSVPSARRPAAAAVKPAPKPVPKPTKPAAPETTGDASAATPVANPFAAATAPADPLPPRTPAGTPLPPLPRRAGRKSKRWLWVTAAVAAYILGCLALVMLLKQ